MVDEGDGDQEDEAWKGWAAEDHPVIEEAERLDELVGGFMDEEQGGGQERMQMRGGSDGSTGKKKAKRCNRTVHVKLALYHHFCIRIAWTMK